MKHTGGYCIYQVDLHYPAATASPDWHGEVLWCVGSGECKAALKYLEKAFPTLHFFITKVG